MKKFAFVLFLPILLFIGSLSVCAQDREEDLSKYFHGHTATFVLFDVKNNKWTRFNKQRSTQRFSPCSTFKIPNSLIGLETGVIADENFVIKWDGVKRSREPWNHDHNLQTAIRDSVVWYYQELARRVGQEKMKHYITAMHYGNEDISGGIDRFWLNDSIKISAEEQVKFLLKLHKNELPVSARSLKIVKDITTLSNAKGVIFRGKTGSWYGDNEGSLGWFVGYVERDGNAYIFAANAEDPAGKVIGPDVRRMVETLLKDKGLL
ncbi:MAG: class D beta-lactamase [Blastocatellia bacterium]|nr:class D beta-lactamase [Blastocatellia bacterium]